MSRGLPGILCVLSLSFWFFLAFPFANHNESYLHVAAIRQQGLLDFALRGLPNNSQYRPFAFATEWLTYNLSGGTIAAAQLFNYPIAATAWIIMLRAVAERRVFGLVALTLGATFFTGYLFLFHIQGSGYGPLLLFVALLFVLHKDIWVGNRLIWVSVASLIAVLFHPFAPLIYLGFVCGLVLENPQEMRSRGVLVVSSAVALLGLAKLLNMGSTLPLTARHLQALIASYRSTEIYSVQSLVGLLLLLATATGMELSARPRVGLFACLAVLSVAAWWLRLPVVMLWVLLCVVKMAQVRRYSFATLILVCFFLPIVGATGMPTHAIYALMASAAALSLGWSSLEDRLIWVTPRLVFALAICAGLLVLSLRSGLHVPVLSAIAHSILAEKEKSYQLEHIIY